MADKHARVVILGGGFGGLTTARHLVRLGVVGNVCEVTVIDARDVHVYTPWLYEAATNALKGETVETRERMYAQAQWFFAGLPGFKNVRFIQGDVEDCDFETRHVRLQGGRFVPYDILVIAMGSETNDFGIPGLAEYALTLKSVDDAMRVHTALQRVCDRASVARPQHIVVAGAGANGTELVSELAHALRVLERRGRLPSQSVQIVLVDPGPTILPMLPKHLQARTLRRLRSLGIEVRLGLRVAEVQQDAVRVFTATGKSQDVLRLPADVCLWSGGVKMGAFVKGLPLQRNDRDRIVVRATHEVMDRPGIFALGDCAARANPDPQTAQAAHHQAQEVARNVVHVLRDQSLRPIPVPRRWTFVSALGGKYAVGVVGGWGVWGYPAYVLRRFSDLYYFLTVLPPYAAVSRWYRGVRLYRQNDR